MFQLLPALILLLIHGPSATRQDASLRANSVETVYGSQVRPATIREIRRAQAAFWRTLVASNGTDLGLSANLIDLLQSLEGLNPAPSASAVAPEVESREDQTSVPIFPTPECRLSDGWVAGCRFRDGPR